MIFPVYWWFSITTFLFLPSIFWNSNKPNPNNTSCVPQSANRRTPTCHLLLAHLLHNYGMSSHSHNHIAIHDSSTQTDLLGQKHEHNMHMMMGMNMAFHFGTNETILFGFWHISSAIGIILNEFFTYLYKIELQDFSSPPFSSLPSVFFSNLFVGIDFSTKSNIQLKY